MVPREQQGGLDARPPGGSAAQEKKEGDSRIDAGARVTREFIGHAGADVGEKIRAGYRGIGGARHV
jgi:hypothetical protein